MFYDLVVFKQNAGVNAPKLGRWLGLSHRIQQLTTYWILPASVIPISCHTVQRLTVPEEQTTEWKSGISAFEEGLDHKFNANYAEIIWEQLNKLSDVDSETIMYLESEDKDFLIGFEWVINDASIREIEDSVTDLDTGINDPYLNMEFGISRGEKEDLKRVRVKRRSVDVKGRPIGQASNTLMLDTIQYEVEFLDREIKVFTENIIAENLISQVE